MIALPLAILVGAWLLSGDPRASSQSQAVSNSVETKLKPISTLARARGRASFTISPAGQAGIIQDLRVPVSPVETDQDLRSEARERAVRSIPLADVPAALNLLLNRADPATVELRDLLVRRWAEEDPTAAATWVGVLTNESDSRALLGQVAIAWANIDLGAAINWLCGLQEGENKNATVLTLAYEAARTEPFTALRLATGLPASHERDELLAHAISQWAATDSVTAAAWADKVPDPILRQRLVASVAIQMAEHDGPAAATLVATTLEKGEEQNRAAVSVAQRWAQKAPEAVASWVSQFPEATQDAALQSLLAVWTVQNPEAAQNWLHAAGLPLAKPVK